MSNNPRTHIEEQISAAAPAALSAVEEAALLESVRARVLQASVPSSFIPWFAHYHKSMIPIALIFALLLGAGGTAAASDSARPGDFLFPVDRAIEDFRFSIASDDEKQNLRIRFADERLREFDSIVDDEVGDDDAEGALSEAEADIFTNETVVKIEVGNRTTVFTTDADTRDEIIEVIVDRYGFTRQEVDAVLSVETEDRESTTDDRGDVRTASQKLENALEVLGDFIERNRDAASTSPEVLTALALIENRLLERSAWFPEEVRLKVRDDRARYEVRGENGERVRVEVKDGEVRIKSRDDDDEDEDDDNRTRVGTSTPSGFLQVEADIFTDTTIVKVELRGKATVFTTDADTRSEIIDEVQKRFTALSEAEIDAALDMETEDRASRTADLDDEDSSDDDDDSSDRSDDDEDDDDDSSGHGGSHDDDEDDEDEDEDDDEDDDNDSSGKGSGKDDKDDDD